MQCYNRLYESTVIYLAIILWVYIWVPNGAVMNVVAIHMPLHVSLLMGARVFLTYILGEKVAMMEVMHLFKMVTLISITKKHY